jgi:transposase InsO family protein
LELAQRIRKIQDPKEGGDKAYGRPRVTAELNDGVPPDERINHKRVGRVMAKHHLPGIRLRKKVKTTQSEQSDEKFPDLLKRDFTASEINKKYSGDITYIPIADGTNLYLASVLDLCSKKIPGWFMADNMRTELVENALKAAAQDRGSLQGAIFHSDHGSQYTSADYVKLCKELGVTQSMGAVGTSADNAPAESLWASMKREILNGRSCFATAEEAYREVFRWINKYNNKRRHSAIGYVSPGVFEKQKQTKYGTIA